MNMQELTQKAKNMAADQEAILPGTGVWKSFTDMLGTEMNKPLVMKTCMNSFILGFWDGINFYTPEGTRVSTFAIKRVFVLPDHIETPQQPFEF
jgi:hypothetical protein